MQVVPFEKLRITTMTIILGLSNPVNTELAFHLLPITRIEVQQTRGTTKCKLPHCSTPGSILSMKYLGNVRGIIKTAANPFKNAVTIDISTKLKNNNLKLSPMSIQMCGASSLEDGIESAEHVIRHLRHIEFVLSKIRADKALAEKTTQWVKDMTRGPPIERVIQKQEIWGGREITVMSKTTPYSVVIPTVNVDPEMDVDIALFMASMMYDFAYHDDMCKKLDFILNLACSAPEEAADEQGGIKRGIVITEPLTISRIDQAMVNYNYNLGFCVDRAALTAKINGLNGFFARFDNALTNAVTVELPYEADRNNGIKRRNKDVPHHTFLVYKSGAVTQSGPGPDLMRDVYYIFMASISQIKDSIIYKEPQLITEYNTTPQIRLRVVSSSDGSGTPTSEERSRST